jgi:hypothetical protein
VALGFRTPALRSTYTAMSMFGRGSSAPSGAVNSERMEAAIQECAIIPFITFTASNPPARLDMVTDIFNRLVSQVV